MEICLYYHTNMLSVPFHAHPLLGSEKEINKCASCCHGKHETIVFSVSNWSFTHRGEDRLVTVFLWSQGNLMNMALYRIIYDSRNCASHTYCAVTVWSHEYLNVLLFLNICQNLFSMTSITFFFFFQKYSITPIHNKTTEGNTFGFLD